MPVGAPSPIVDQALLTASGQTTSSPPVQTFIGAPVLTIVKSNAPTASVTLVPGDPITYTMVVQNTGVGDATNVVVRDVVPADTGYVSCTGGTSCAQAAGVISWTLGTLGVGGDRDGLLHRHHEHDAARLPNALHDLEHRHRDLDRDADPRRTATP